MNHFLHFSGKTVSDVFKPVEKVGLISTKIISLYESNFLYTSTVIVNLLRCQDLLLNRFYYANTQTCMVVDRHTTDRTILSKILWTICNPNTYINLHNLSKSTPIPGSMTMSKRLILFPVVISMGCFIWGHLDWCLFSFVFIDTSRRTSHRFQQERFVRVAFLFSISLKQLLYFWCSFTIHSLALLFHNLCNKTTFIYLTLTFPSWSHLCCTFRSLWTF